MVADSVAFEPMTGGAAISTSQAAVFAYRSGRGPVTQLAWVRSTGSCARNARLVTGRPAVSNLASIARRAPRRRGAHGPERDRAVATRSQPSDAVHADGRRSHSPISGAVAARGDRIAFASGRTGSVQAVRAAIGAAAMMKTCCSSRRRDAIPTDWSPDGRFLLYFAPSPKTGTDVWVLPQGDTPALGCSWTTAANEMWGQFSPDGRWVAYQSNENGTI